MNRLTGREPRLRRKTSAVKQLMFACLVWLAAGQQANAGNPILTVVDAHGARHYSAEELLRRKSCSSPDLRGDDYHHKVQFRAVPLLSLFDEDLDPADTLEATALDGFVAEIPLRQLVGKTATGDVAWIAVEDPARPWPNLPGQDVTAGPFYLLWEPAKGSYVSPETAPYRLASLKIVADPTKRWPQLVPSARLNSQAVRRGQTVFFRECMPCHKMSEAGDGELGPDLGRPMRVTDYLKDDGIKAIIRNPRSVRTWPTQYMPGFKVGTLSDEDLDNLIAYFHALAAR